jgi:hypothetical protein
VPFADVPVTWPSGESLSFLYVVLLFVGVPLLIVAVIFLLVYAPSTARSPRYRPGLAWRAEPEWFDGPAEGLAALDVGSADRGGQLPAGPSTGATAHSPEREPRREPLASGGASASW